MRRRWRNPTEEVFMASVRGIVISENQFNGYKPPGYELKDNERILSAELKRESGNQLTLYMAVETSEPEKWPGEATERREPDGA
jgi:hypothetical protein